eukprot:5439434-Amphidinium_carterae.1
MRSEQLFAEYVTSGTWGGEKASSSSEPEDASPFVQRGSLSKGRFFGGPKISSHRVLAKVRRRTVRLTPRSRKNGSST